MEVIMDSKYGQVPIETGAAMMGLGFHKFGRNPDSNTQVEEVIWDRGGTEYPWPSTAATTTISSDSASDAVGLGGCEKVHVFGLDENYCLKDEIVTLHGVTPVTLETEYLRVHRAYNCDSHKARGDIQIKHGSTILAQITKGREQTEMCVFTVPARHALLISMGSYSSEGRREVSFTLWHRSVGGVFRPYQNFTAYGQGVSLDFKPNLRFDEKEDIMVTAKNKGNKDVIVGELFGYLVKP